MRAQEGDGLADALASATVSSVCDCGESDCFTFSTHESHGAEYFESIQLDDAPGIVLLDVSGSRELLGVEIIGWGTLRPTYLEFRERVRTWR